MLRTLVLVIALAVVLSGCGTWIPAGGLYTEGKMGVVEKGGKITKTGKACMKSYLALVAVGDASMEAAKKNGRIKTVVRINYEVKNILGVYGEYCLIVKGR